MYEFYTMPWALQKSLVEVTTANARVFSEAYLRFLEQQSDIFCRIHNCRRADESTGSAKSTGRPTRQNVRKSPCCGADLNDHYGKRVRDIDVQRI